MRDSSTFVMCSAPPFGKGGQGGIHTPYLQAAVAESPLNPLFQRGEKIYRAFGA